MRAAHVASWPQRGVHPAGTPTARSPSLEAPKPLYLLSLSAKAGEAPKLFIA